jgi:hypothetical protein
MKIALDVETQTPLIMQAYAGFCGWGWLTTRPANRNDRPLGRSDDFDEAIGDYALAYADQVERDYDLRQGSP